MLAARESIPFFGTIYALHSVRQGLWGVTTLHDLALGCGITEISHTF